MSLRQLVRFLLGVVLLCPSTQLLGQGNKLTLVTSFGSETGGTPTASWLGDDLFAAGLDNTVRKYAIPQTIDPSSRPSLVDTFVPTVRRMPLSERSASILSLSIRESSRQFVIGSTDFQARLWTVDRDRTLANASGALNELRLNRATKILAAALSDRIALWKVSEQPGVLPSQTNAISVPGLVSFEFQDSSASLVTIVAGASDGKIYLIRVDPISLQEKSRYAIETPDDKSSLLTPNGKFYDKR